MSADELSSIRSNHCFCEAYHDVHKQDGHLMITDCGVLPSESLSALGNMGAKYRPHDCPSYLNPESRSEILTVMQGAVAQFARQAEARIGTPGCMTAWQSEVDVKIAEQVNQIPDGTLLDPHEALPYSPSDRRLMSEFLQNFVCTPMDKAADTFVFQCIKVYINDLVSDLEDPQGTYEMVDEHAEAWKQTFQTFVDMFNLDLPPLTDISPAGIVAMHRQFRLLFGLAVDEAFEHIAYYKLTRKMHKDPIGARFISSSESSSMQPISKGLSGLFKVVQSEVGTLFGNALQSMSISEKWTARSWVITNIYEFIPLIRVWNSQYAAVSRPVS